MVTSDLRHTECSNLTKATWAEYKSNHENNMPSCFGYHHVCFVVTNDVRKEYKGHMMYIMCPSVHQLPKRHYSHNREGILFL